MPNPSAVKASDVNIEIGVSGSTEIKWGNNWVRNVATQYTGTNSDVNASKFRWGINFPGGVNDSSGYVKFYNTDLSDNRDGSYLSVMAADDAYGSPTYSSATVEISGNGKFIFVSSTVNYGSHQDYSTWFTSGSVSDYTVQFLHTSGVTPVGNSVNTDIALTSSSLIGWTITAEPSNWNIQVENIARGSFIVKSGGNQLISRPVYLYASAISYLS